MADKSTKFGMEPRLDLSIDFCLGAFLDVSDFPRWRPKSKMAAIETEISHICVYFIKRVCLYIFRVTLHGVELESLRDLPERHGWTLEVSLAESWVKWWQDRCLHIIPNQRGTVPDHWCTSRWTLIWEWWNCRQLCFLFCFLAQILLFEIQQF